MTLTSDTEIKHHPQASTWMGEQNGQLIPIRAWVSVMLNVCVLPVISAQ